MNEDLNAEGQRNRIKRSGYLSKVYSDLYSTQVLAANLNLRPIEVALEIGSAGGFLESADYVLFRSDVREDSYLNIRLDGQLLPIRDSSVDAIFMKDSIHHIPDVESFLQEALRVLRPGGGVVCLDPYWGPVAQLVYRLFHPEVFDTRTPHWKFLSSKPEDANQALLYLLLRRDRDVFRTRYPSIEVIELGPFLGPSYILSGGITRNPILPSWFLQILYSYESKRIWWRKFFALEFLVVFRKNAF
jgi:SAM-dependent methyltransferase